MIVEGDSHDNVCDGTSGADLMMGRGGNDTLRGLGGNDDVQGGHGNDRVYGGGGSDVVRGGHDDDEVQGADGVDWLYGEPPGDPSWDAGNDVGWGGPGGDRFYDYTNNQDDADRFYGGGGSDWAHVFESEEIAFDALFMQTGDDVNCPSADSRDQVDMGADEDLNGQHCNQNL